MIRQPSWPWCRTPPLRRGHCAGLYWKSSIAAIPGHDALNVVPWPITIPAEFEPGKSIFDIIRAGDVLTARAVYSEVYRRDGKKPMLLQMADLRVDDAQGERVAVVRVASVCF